MILNIYIRLLLFFLLGATFFFGCSKEDDVSIVEVSPIISPTPPDASNTPSVITLEPLNAGNGGTITILGKHLMPKKEKPKVIINKKILELLKASDDSVVAKIPKLLGSGKISIMVAGTAYPGPEFIYNYKINVITIAGNGSVGQADGNAINASFNCPRGIVADKNGDLFVADCYNRLIRKFSATSQQVTSIFIPSGSIPASGTGHSFYSPYNIALDSIKRELYVTDFNTNILKVNLTGGLSAIYTGESTTTGIGIAKNGYLYITNNIKGTIIKMNTTGGEVSNVVTGLVTPRNLIFDKSDNMFVSAYDARSGSSGIFNIDKADKPVLVKSDKEFNGWEIAVDTAGNFYEADYFNNRIRLVEKNGRALTIAGNGVAADVDGNGINASFDGPQSIAIDAKGNLYVTTYNYEKATGNKIRKIIIE